MAVAILCERPVNLQPELLKLCYELAALLMRVLGRVSLSRRQLTRLQPSPHEHRQQRRAALFCCLVVAKVHARQWRRDRLAALTCSTPPARHGCKLHCALVDRLYVVVTAAVARDRPAVAICRVCCSPIRSVESAELTECFVDVGRAGQTSEIRHLTCDGSMAKRHHSSHIALGHLAV